MVYQDIEFFNVDHLQEVSGMVGLRMDRFPYEFSRTMGESFNHNARFRGQRVHGCEIRFVTEASYFEIGLTAAEGPIDIVIYRGDRVHEKHTLQPGVCSVLHVENPPISKLVDISQVTSSRFAPDVWRILFGVNGYAYFHYLDTYGYGHRPPKKEEKPSVSWAAYGSSITCGHVTTMYTNSYLNQAALRLGYDVLNKGLSGSCFCEKQAADYLAGLDVDVLSLEIGVNMVESFSAEDFEIRCRYLLEKIKRDRKAKKVYVIDMFPNKGVIALDHQSKYYVNYRRFKQIVRSLMNDCADENMILVHGEDVLKDFSYLSTDLLHPSDEGHVLMGENLAKIMRG